MTKLIAKVNINLKKYLLKTSVISPLKYHRQQVQLKTTSPAYKILSSSANKALYNVKSRSDTNKPISDLLHEILEAWIYE